MADHCVTGLDFLILYGLVSGYPTSLGHGADYEARNRVWRTSDDPGKEAKAAGALCATWGVNKITLGPRPWGSFDAQLQDPLLYVFPILALCFASGRGMS